MDILVCQKKESGFTIHFNLLINDQTKYSFYLFCSFPLHEMGPGLQNWICLLELWKLSLSKWYKMTLRELGAQDEGDLLVFFITFFRGIYSQKLHVLFPWCCNIFQQGTHSCMFAEWGVKMPHSVKTICSPREGQVVLQSHKKESSIIKRYLQHRSTSGII